MDGAIQLQTQSENRPVQSGQDPMAVRWGIQFAARDKFIDSDKAGFTILPFAKFFQVKRFEIPEAIHTVDDNPNLPKEQMVTKTAQSVQWYLEEMLAGKTFNGNDDPHKKDQGARFGFFGEKDVAKMEVISTTLLPTLAQIRTIGGQIPDKCPGEDMTDFAGRDTCPTCWLDWIQSPECDSYIAQIARDGRDVELTDTVTGQVELRHVTPELFELETARQVIIESLRHGIATAQAVWGQIAKEMKEGERRGVDVYQNNLRKDLHADSPADAETRQMREVAKAIGNTNGGSDGAVMERVVGVLDRIDQRLSKLETPAQEITVEPDMTTPAGRMAYARSQKGKGE